MNLTPRNKFHRSPVFRISLHSAVLIILFSFASRQNGKPPKAKCCQPFELLKISADSVVQDTLSLEEMKKLTMNDVDSMTVNPERTRAYIKLKNGKKYIVIITDDIRNAADAKYKSQKAGEYIQRPIDSTRIDTSVNHNKTFAKVEIESEYPGGIAAWYHFLGKNLVYPDKAIANEIQGQVVVRFIVDKDGNISDIEAVSGPVELRAACITVIKKSGKWVPAQLGGQPVKSYKSQPINFKIEASTVRPNFNNQPGSYPNR